MKGYGEDEKSKCVLGRSRCRDAGILLDWTVGAKDLGGLHDRWIGAAPDLGCYESWKIPGLLLFVR